MKRISRLETEKDTLSLAVKNMLRTIKRSDECIGILQENMTDVEYEHAMDEYYKADGQQIKTYRNLPSREIAQEAKTILQATGDILGSDELGEILNLNVMDVEHSLREYSSFNVYKFYDKE